MKPYAAVLPFLFLPLAAWGQGAVVQSGVVVPGDFASWIGNGIVKDSGVNSITLNFPSIANGDVIGNCTGSVATAADSSLSCVVDTLGTPAQGDILYRNASKWVILPPGTTGQYLETLGSAANPTWNTIPTYTYTAGGGLTLSGPTFSLTAPVSPANGGTGLTSGTSGGIPAFTGSQVIASSPLLTQYAVILGGGAGATPAPIASLGTTGQALVSNGAAAAPTFQTIAAGTVTSVNTSGAITGGPITSGGTITATAATSGVQGVVTPDTNNAHFLNGAGTWTTPAGTTPAPLIGTTGSIFGSTIAPTVCAASTLAVTGATTSEAVSITPAVYPGDGFTWNGYVSTAGTVTLKLCNFTGSSLAPSGASLWNIRVIP